MAITWKQIKDSLGLMCPGGPDAIRFYLESIQTVLFCEDGTPLQDDCIIVKGKSLKNRKNKKASGLTAG